MSIKSTGEPAGAQPGMPVPPTAVEPVVTPHPPLAPPESGEAAAPSGASPAGSATPGGAAAGPATPADLASGGPAAAATPASSRRVPPRPWGPDSMSWKRGIAWRAALASRATLLMQVAHPVVGAGVADHSEFLKDRWGRITATAAAARRFSGLEGEQAALDEGARLRRVHRDIGGTDAKGRAYHALDPEAYLWVAATGYWAGTAIRRLHGAEFDTATEDQLYREWTDQARVLRIPERVIPAGRPEFWTWFDHIVNDVLERNWTTDLLIDLDRHPLPPHPRFPLPRPIWNVPAIPLAALLRLTTVGYLPPVLRDRLGLTWDYPRAARFATVVAVTDGLDRVLPDRIRYPLSARTG